LNYDLRNLDSQSFLLYYEIVLYEMLMKVLELRNWSGGPHQFKAVACWRIWHWQLLWLSIRVITCLASSFSIQINEWSVSLQPVALPAVRAIYCTVYVSYIQPAVRGQHAAQSKVLCGPI